MTNPQTKRCTKCGTEHAATTENFAPDKRKRGGLVSWCRQCKREQDRESARERMRRYHATPEGREYRRKYFVENREALREKDRKYRAENREALRARRAEHRERNIAKCSLRRARKLRSLPKWETPDSLRDFIATRWAVAGFLGVPESALHLAHVVPLKAYGYINGKRVRVASGLHTVANLEWMLARENLQQNANLDESLLDTTPVLDYDITMPGGHILRIRQVDVD